jgi:spermidine synthase
LHPTNAVPSATKTSRRPPAIELTPEVSAAAPVHNRYLAGLVLLFIGSGCAALIYEIVWFQLLSLIVGSSAVSMGVLLGTFMGGMCIGSLFLSKYISRRAHPLRVYAMLEVGIAVFGLLVLWGLPYAGGLYFAIAVHGMSGTLVRGLFCAICLLPPTLLMGATLPAIARWVETSREGVAWLGFFYGGNIAGAVFGCLLAGFYLLRVHDMAYATYVAVMIDVAVALASLALARVTAHTPNDVDEAPPSMSLRALIPAGSWPVYLVIALSGATALAAEAVWTRLLSLLLGATTYTFSLILASFLFGLGIGSSLGSMLTRTLTDPKRALGVCQLLLTAAIAWAAYSMTRMLPYWPISPGLTNGPNPQFEIDLVRCLWAVLPAAILRACRCGPGGAGPRSSRRHCVRREHGWRNHWRAVRQLVDHRVARHAAGAAYSHRDRGDQRDHRVHSDRQSVDGEGRRHSRKLRSRIHLGSGDGGHRDAVRDFRSGRSTAPRGLWSLVREPARQRK